MADAAKAGAEPKAGGDGSPEGGAAKPPPKQPEGEAARVEGLRGWLARLNRMVAIRTRVGLVLLAIGIGCAAAAAYLAIDTREDSASEGDLRELRSELEQATGTGGAETAALEAQLERLRERVQTLAADQAAAERAAAEAAPDAKGERGRGRSEEGANTSPEAGSGEAGSASKGDGTGSVSTGDGE